MFFLNRIFKNTVKHINTQHKNALQASHSEVFVSPYDSISTLETMFYKEQVDQVYILNVHCLYQSAIRRLQITHEANNWNVTNIKWARTNLYTVLQSLILDIKIINLEL